jgi:transcriptional regulator with XRE-family HTH domain
VSGLGEMTPLRRLCIEKGITRRTAAARAGLNHQTVYNLEAGKWSEATLAKLAPVFDMTPLELGEALGFFGATEAAA